MSLFGTLVLALAYAFLRRATTLYTISARDVRVTSGILARRMAAAPYGRITNVAANQSFFERLLDLVDLRVDTAGGDQAEVVFRRITKSDGRAAGEILRDIIDRQNAAQIAPKVHAQAS